MPASPSREGEDRRRTLDNALLDLKTAARIPAKQRAIKITRVVERVSTIAYENGLSRQQLEELIDIITLPNDLDQASVGNLIRNLYPNTKVSDDAIIKVVGSLGHGLAKAFFPAQAALIKWLIMVHEVLENPKILSQLYGFLFNLLDTIAIRAPLCYLLSLITRRRHVRPFRIQMLLELSRRVGNEPPLVGLVRVYKDYYPDVIVGDAVSGRASVFTHPNQEWKQRLREMQEAHAHRTHDSQSNQQQSFKVVRHGLQRSKASVVPEVRTSRAQETSVTLEEIENVHDFISKLERIDLPNQLVAVMGDPLLQKLLQLKSSDMTLRRVDNWLTAFFDDQLLDSSNSEQGILEMLAAIRGYARFSKTLPTACLLFLRSMLPNWNGITGREVILDLLTYIPIEPFEDLRASTLDPLVLAMTDNTPATLLPILDLLTALLQNWTVFLFTSPPPPYTTTTIDSLTTYTHTLCLTLITHPLSSPTLTAPPILSYLHLTATLHTSALSPLIRITTPPASLIYTLFFQPSLSTLSLLCTILATYKRAFEAAMSSATTLPYPKDYVNHFNGFLMDICNCIWRGRAFNTSDVNALGCLLPLPIVPALTTYVSGLDSHLALPSLFGLSFSPTMCALAIQFVREAEDKAVEEGTNVTKRHAGPVTQRSLVQLGKEGGLALAWADYRLGVLQFLEGKGVVGVGELMYNTMKHLMTAREKV